MQILIKIKSGDSVNQVKLTPNPGKELELSTPLRIWHDMRTVPAAAGRDLRHWKVLRRGQKFTGLANDEGPRLGDKDEVTFVVSPPSH